jgi:catechol 2,3-dioxygenase-like lactoylglutathione lyase family enzyme
MLQDIDHIQIAMPKGQEPAARAFYGSLLGMREIGKPENLQARGGVWFTLGHRQVHLGIESDFHPARKAHPAFLVKDLAALEKILQMAGYPIIDDEPLLGHKRFYSHDPFGNRLEFIQRL